jgi:hypothetical protein
VQLLQEVFGTSGATAIGAEFTNNQVELDRGLVQSPSRFTEPGAVTDAVATTDHPTTAGWLDPPDAAGLNGGSFYVSCC